MAVQPGLCRTWSETPKTGFLRTRPKLLAFVSKNCIKADILVISGTMIGGCKISIQRRHKTESFGNAVQEKTDHYTGMSKVK